MLGAGFGVAVAVGSTIGSGILGTPGVVARLLPDPLLFFGVWILGALYALLGANAMAELTAMSRESGGYTVFARRALGPYAGFIAGWSDWLSTCGSIAAGSLVLGTALLGEGGATAARVASGIAAVVILAIVQWRGVREGARVQEWTAVLKTVAFLALAAAALFWSGPRAPAQAPAPTGVGAAIAVVLAMQAIIYTYDGYAGLIYFGGEVRNPGRDVPRGMFGGVALVALVYLALNAGFAHVLGMSGLAKSELAASSVAGIVLGEAGGNAVRAVVAVSLASALNAYLMMGARIFHRLSENEGFDRGAAVNAGGTPTFGLAVSAMMSAAMAVSGTFQQVIAVTAVFFVANYALAFTSLFVLRAREPNAERPYRAVGHPWTTGLVFLLSLALLAAIAVADRRNSLYALGALALSVPLYLVVRRSRPADS